ncbi:MAG: hypothetical protein ATN35_10770 [Epulopiscium sp. Nele67-Bin004]|nr:MAG: hypothetical protein ATN35_10770 [Epulopiscium sp. Nele67-Bin004]
MCHKTVQDSSPVDFYIGICGEKSTIGKPIETLKSGIMGNLAGTEYDSFGNDSKTGNLLNDIMDIDSNFDLKISSVSCSASLRKKDSTEEKDFVQGIEKFIDAMQGQIYTAMFIAEPISNNELSQQQNGYQQMYTNLSKFEKVSLQYQEGESVSIMESTTEGLSQSLTDTLGYSNTQAKFASNSNTSSRATSESSSANIGFLGMGVSTSISQSITNSNSRTTGQSNSNSQSTSKATSNSTSSSDTKGQTITTNSGKTLQLETLNRPVKDLLNNIDLQIEKLERGRTYGLFKYGAYFLSSEEDTAILAANTYKALMIGDNSTKETTAINIWKETEQVNLLKEYLIRGRHPIFTNDTHGLLYDATILVDGLTLPVHMSLPFKSVVGLPVLEHVRFGRNNQSISSKENEINLGNLYHMGSEDTTQPIVFDKESLTSHMLVTGSTGSGKSNALYQILNELNRQKIPFLVVEPAKGEYKNIFGNKEGVNVFGTNIRKSPLLKINPFKFPDDIHVLEHIDKLIEILNVCWPMYAAMPAILKDAVIRAYESKGWDLNYSVNKYSTPIYPMFSDVLQQIYNVMNTSEYAEEQKSNYIGALATRVKSLTNGINGQIFTNREIDSEVLFDQNTIIDLSRVTSSETKSLIMGILVMRLQEYRISQGGMNKPLQHVTILEEAHHLLKRTSTEQSTEGANVIGKSVEMLSQSIAEMRTYGEGFIIVDQSPNMLDMSAIRNTNTKIILRLPDVSDRDLCGKSANLDDEQITELARLSTGVATVYQNNWLEPILCKINKVQSDDNIYDYTPPELNNRVIDTVIDSTEVLKMLSERNYSSIDEWNNAIVSMLQINHLDLKLQDLVVNSVIKRSLKTSQDNLLYQNWLKYIKEQGRAI